MYKQKHLTIISGGKQLVLSVDSILYILMSEKVSEVHIFDGTVYKTRMKLNEFESLLDDRQFIKIHRGCLVAVRAIHNITDKIELSNGEKMIYTLRKKNQIIEQFRIKQEAIIHTLHSDGVPLSAEDYRNHYSCFDTLPIAFTDIELVFNGEKRAVDWIFRYANSVLADLEKIPLERLLGNSFASLFANMDSKWLRAYERVVLYGETMEIVDYSPEIDVHLKIICFPTFQGHCGCILFDVSKLKADSNGADVQKALAMHFANYN